MHSSTAGAAGGMEMTGDLDFFFDMDGFSNEKYINSMSDVDESDSDGMCFFFFFVIRYNFI